MTWKVDAAGPQPLDQRVAGLKEAKDVVDEVQRRMQ
jgi:hypothetical protein